jgi:anti-sigma factor RsiW
VEHDKFRSKLSAYQDGEIDAELRDEISLHLRECAICRKELSELKQIDSLLGGMPDLGTSEALASQIVANVAQAERDNLSKDGLPHRIFTRVLQIADSVFELMPGRECQKTSTLDEFGDFPPLLLSHAYFQVIGRP